MKQPAIAWFGATVLLTCVGCGFKIGPAHPEKDGKVFLESHGYAQSVIEVVVNRGVLDRQQLLEFSKCKSADVRFLVASNPHLRAENIDLFLTDPNDYARSGAAYNPNLSSQQMIRLFFDPSHTVYCGLAKNPFVPADLLLRLHKERNPGLAWFAMNPKCPDTLKAEIRKSNDDDAKRWLDITEERKLNEPNNSER